MITHSSILAWRIPSTEEPGRLQSIELQESHTAEQLSTACSPAGWYHRKSSCHTSAGKMCSQQCRSSAAPNFTRADFEGLSRIFRILLGPTVAPWYLVIKRET